MPARCVRSSACSGLTHAALLLLQEVEGSPYDYPPVAHGHGHGHH